MSAINDLSHCCFLPRGANREPALLLVAPDGQTCLWEGISSSLTRQDRAQRITAPLSSTSETIVQLQRIDESTVVLATSQSRLLRVSVGSRAGVLQAEIRPFSQPRGLLGRLFGLDLGYGFRRTIRLRLSPSHLPKPPSKAAKSMRSAEDVAEMASARTGRRATLGRTRCSASGGEQRASTQR